jgi:hypothetical protein
MMPIANENLGGTVHMGNIRTDEWEAVRCQACGFSAGVHPFAPLLNHLVRLNQHALRYRNANLLSRL